MSKNKLPNQVSFLVGLTASLLLLSSSVMAQESDTTKVEIDLEKQHKIKLHQQLNRSMSGGIMTEMGTYKVPEETEYYTPPFKGQHYLDLAVEAYRKELKNRIGNDWYWQFLRTVAPYINNQFEFGVYQINDIDFVGRDNPLFQSDQ